jgi:hypothetical protein
MPAASGLRSTTSALSPGSGFDASDQRQEQSVVKVRSHVSHVTHDASQAVPTPSVSWLLTRL